MRRTIAQTRMHAPGCSVLACAAGVRAVRLSLRSAARADRAGADRGARRVAAAASARRRLARRSAFRRCRRPATSRRDPRRERHARDPRARARPEGVGRARRAAAARARARNGVARGDLRLALPRTRAPAVACGSARRHRRRDLARAADRARGGRHGRGRHPRRSRTRCSIGSATSRCRATSSATIHIPPTASVIRRCSPASPAPSPRRPPACT